MAPEPVPLNDRIARITALLGAITALVTGVLALAHEVKPFAAPVIDQLAHKAPAVRGAVIALLLLSSALLLKRLSAKRMHTRLGPQGTDFIGRELETKNLKQRAIDHRLVFVVGESGVGKSALVEHALPEAILIRSWGDEWDSPPRALLSAVLARCPNSDAIPEATTWSDRIRRLSKAQAQPLLVVMDAFDDYSVRFQKQLFDAKNTRYLSPTELKAGNSFWNEIAVLLAEGYLHCVIVTRSDVQGALSAVRFQEPETMFISRLSNDDARRLLDSIFGITDEDEEWRALRSQLLVDLSEKGGMLPEQVRSARRAVSIMATRTVREYRARGGLVGLEVVQLDDVLQRSAHTADLTLAAVRQLALSMVDDSSSPPKARAVQWSSTTPTHEQSSLTMVTSLDLTKVENLMNLLEENQIIRQQASDPQTWILHHDYIARVVIAMTRQVDRTTAQLADAHRAYRESRGVVARYLALLPVWAQVVLGMRRLAGGFAYGRYRNFALISTIRWIPYAAVFAALIYFRMNSQADDYGRRLLSRLSSRSGLPQPDEVSALWDLKEASRREQRAFIARALEQPETAANFTRRADYMVHAIVGFDRGRRNELLGMIEARCKDGADVEQWLSAACVRIGLALEADSDEFWRLALSSFIRAASDPDARDTDVSLDEWTNWISTSTVPATLNAQQQTLFWNGVEKILSTTTPTARPNMRQQPSGRGVLVDLGQVVSRFDLMAPSDRAARLLDALVKADYLDIEQRIALAWRIAVVAPDKTVPVMAELLGQLSRLQPLLTPPSTWSDPSLHRELKGSGLLFIALTEYAKVHDDTKHALLHELEFVQPELPIESSELPHVLNALHAMMPPVSSPPLDGSTDTRPTYDEAAQLKKLSNKIDELTPSLRRINRAELISDIRDLGTTYIHITAAKKRGDIRAFLQQLLDGTRSNLLFCLLLADTADLPDNYTLSLTDPKDTWFQACGIAAQMLDAADDTSSSKAREMPKQQSCDQIVEDVLAGKRELDVDHIVADVNTSTGQPKAAAVIKLVDLIISAAEKQPRRSEQWISLAKIVTTRVDDPGPVANHLVEIAHDTVPTRTLSVVTAKLVTETLGSLDARYLSVPNIEDVATQVIALVHDDVRTHDLKEPLAKVCAGGTSAQRATVANRVATAMSGTTDISELDALRPCMVAVRAELAPKAILKLLEWPTCVGPCRADLVEALAQRMPQQSRPSYWAVEGWARGAHLLDDGPVRRPRAN